MLKRKDATLINEVDAFHSIVPYVMPKRTESEVSLPEEFDITSLVKFIEKYNKSNKGQLKLFHCICYVVARMIYHRPKMNIFIAGKKFWQRNDISLSFVAKQKFNDKAEEVLMFLKTKPEMTVKDISTAIIGDVRKARQDGSNDLDKTMEFVGKLPRPILSLIFFIISRLEYHGIMPESLSKGDPNYSTVLLSNLGSIGAGAPYHHLSNYGTCSIMMTIGTIRYDQKLKKYFVPITSIIDERIADGFYFVKSLKLAKHLFSNPELLLEPIGKAIDFDVDAKPTIKLQKKVKTIKRKTK